MTRPPPTNKSSDPSDYRVINIKFFTLNTNKNYFNKFLFSFNDIIAPSCTYFQSIAIYIFGIWDMIYNCQIIYYYILLQELQRSELMSNQWLRTSNLNLLTFFDIEYIIVLMIDLFDKLFKDGIHSLSANE